MSRVSRGVVFAVVVATLVWLGRQHAEPGSPGHDQRSAEVVCQLGSRSLTRGEIEQIRRQQIPPAPRAYAASFAVDVVVADWLTRGEFVDQAPSDMVRSFRRVTRARASRGEQDAWRQELANARKELKVQCNGTV
jgi:hypothetical protein